jgi:hypothetical protein
MKFISYYKIIICKQNNICEIRDVNDRFKLVTTWRHIGEEIIAMNVYIRGTKEEDEDDKFENSLTDLSYQKYNKERNGDIEYIDTNYKRNKKNKSKNKLSLNENIYGNGLNAKIHLKKFIKDDKVNNSTFRDLMGLNLKNHIKSKEEKDNEIAIYNSNKVSSGKENLTNGLFYYKLLVGAHPRQRAAVAWPLLWTADTFLKLSQTPDLLRADKRVKIPRRVIYKTLFFTPFLLKSNRIFSWWFHKKLNKIS